jgi:hypothetical protein
MVNKLLFSVCQSSDICFQVLSKKRFPLKWSHVLEWAYQTSLGIDYLHSMKVLLLFNWCHAKET